MSGRCVIVNRSTHIRRKFATIWQPVSSCRGPIYRARIYVNTHEMGDGNACVMKRKCIFGNGNMHFCLC